MLKFKLPIAALALGAALSMGALPAAAGSEEGNFMVRVLGAGVLPDADASVSIGGVATPTANADVSDEFIPAATLTYFLTKNIGLELFCCFAKHQADGEGSIAGLGEIADFWIFPPALTATYHFDGMGAFKPYVGAGVQYIYFFDEKSSTAVSDSVEIDDALGFTLQAGVDFSLGGGWYLNADVKKTWIDTEVTWRQNGGTTVTADLDVDPLIVSAGLGYRFNLEDLFGSRSEAAPMK